jgi:hypothetical protein
LKKPLKNSRNGENKNNGTILITGEEKSDLNNEIVEITLEANF